MERDEKSFDTMDQRYLSKAKAREETLETLAQLELEKHKLRLQIVMNGMDEETKLQTGGTLMDGIKRVEKAIEDIENVFKDVLKADQ